MSIVARTNSDGRESDSVWCTGRPRRIEPIGACMTMRGCGGVNNGSLKLTFLPIHSIGIKASRVCAAKGKLEIKFGRTSFGYPMPTAYSALGPKNMTEQTELSGRDRALIDREHRRCALLVERRFSELEQLLDDDLVYAHSTGLVQDRAAYLGYVRGPLAYVSVEHSNLRTRFVADAALLTGHLKNVMRVEGQAASVTIHTHVMQLWVPAEGSWRLAAFQATRLPMIQP